MAQAELVTIAEHPLFAMNTDAIETAAASLSESGASIRDRGADVVSAWAPISTHYSGPGDGELFSTMTPVAFPTTRVGDRLDEIAAALRTFKVTADDVKIAMGQLTIAHALLATRVALFVPDEGMPGTVRSSLKKHWSDDPELDAENTRIIHELNNCLETMHEAERTCANTIRQLHGLEPLLAGDGGLSNGEYGVDSIPDDAETPWGTADVDDESCGEAAWDTVAGMGEDAFALAGFTWNDEGEGTHDWMDAAKTWAGFASLVGYNPENNTWSGETAGATWLGMGKDYIAYDRWGDNPAGATGQLGVNVISSIGVVGIAGKFIKAAHAGSAGDHTPSGNRLDGGMVDPDSYSPGSQQDTAPKSGDSTNPFGDLGVDYDLDKVLNSDSDLDTIGPHTDTDVPPVRDADGASNDTVSGREDAGQENPSDRTLNPKEPEPTSPEPTEHPTTHPAPTDPLPSAGSADGTASTDRTINPATQKPTTDSHGRDISDVISRSDLTVDQLNTYLEATNPHAYADYMSTGHWPADIQVPRDSSVLTESGSIDWSQVPPDGFTLERGVSVKEDYVPEVGEILDRYGPPNGRFTSPVPESGPFSQAQRATPYVEDPEQYHRYEVAGDIRDIRHRYSSTTDVNLRQRIDTLIELRRFRWGDVAYRGRIAAGFGSPGGGVQVQLPLPLDILVGLGVLREIAG